MKTSLASTMLACLACLGAVKPSAADEPLTLGHALQRVAAANPSLAALAAEADAVRARAAREALPPPWILGADIENVAGGGELRGFDNAESTVQLSRTLELGGKRHRRFELGAAETAQAGHALASAGLDLRSLTAQRFVEVAADQQRLALATERVVLATRTRSEVARVVEHARNPETDLRAAEIALADAELEREHAEHELRAARVTLAATWGARQPDFSEALLPLDSLDELEPFDTIAARLPSSAALRSLEFEGDIAAAQVRLAQSESRPDLTLNLGVRRLEAFGDHGLVAGVSLPLGTGSRARLALSESRARAAAVTRRREAIEVDVYQQVFEQYQELRHARAEFETLSRSMIPKAERALALATRGFDLGRFPFSSLAHTQETLFELRRRRIDAAARYHTLFAEMQRLVAAVETP